MSFRLRPAAEADLADIALHIAQDNPHAARAWLNDMLRHCRNLGDMPSLGVARPDIRPELRMLAAGNYLILYREIDGDAEVVRVLHGARKWWALV